MAWRTGSRQWIASSFSTLTSSTTAPRVYDEIIAQRCCSRAEAYRAHAPYFGTAQPGFPIPGLVLAFARELLARGAKKVYAGARHPADVVLPGVVPVRIDVTDPVSVAAAAEQCADTTLLVNNAGIARVMESTLDPALIGTAREIFETNFYRVIFATTTFAPVL